MFSFNTLKRIYIVVVVLLIVIYTYLFWADIVPLLAYFLMADLSGWCVGSVYLTIVQNKVNALNSIMGECKIAEFIEKYSHEHAKDTKKGFSPSSTIMLATAHMHLGDFDTSLDLFQSVELKNPQKVKKKQLAGVVVECAVYHNNLATVYVWQHDIENTKLHIEKAWEYLKQLQGIKDKKGTNNVSIETLKRSLQIREIELGLALDTEMDYVEKINQIKCYLDESENVLRRVYFHYLLSVLYGKTGDEEEVGRCREYVRENGGDTCYVQWVGA